MKGSEDMTAPRERVHECEKCYENLVKAASCGGSIPSTSRRGASDRVPRSDQKDFPCGLKPGTAGYVAFNHGPFPPLPLSRRHHLGSMAPSRQYPGSHEKKPSERQEDSV